MLINTNDPYYITLNIITKYPINTKPKVAYNGVIDSLYVRYRMKMKIATWKEVKYILFQLVSTYLKPFGLCIDLLTSSCVQTYLVPCTLIVTRELFSGQV